MKRKINIDRPDLSAKEIASRQDFSSLMKQLPKVSKPPIYKTGWFITTVASVAGIAIVTTNFILNDKTPTQNTDLATSTETPPPSETSSSIASTAVLNEENNTIDVSFASEPQANTTATKEIQDIPEAQPEYNKADLELQLQAAAEEVKMAKMAYENAVNSRIILEETAPNKPISEGNPDRQFILDVSPNEFPELAMYKDLLFEVEADDPNFSPTVYEEEWEDIRLTTKEPGKTYFLSLSKSITESVTFSVFPVYKGVNYDLALQKYNAEYNTYTKELEKLVMEEENLKTTYDQSLEKLEELQHQETDLSKTN